MSSSLGSNPSEAGGSVVVDNDFGPVVDTSARPFDFTLLFEESILSILPSALFMILAIIRIAVLRTRKPRVQGRAFQVLKLSNIAVLLVLSSALVALWCLDGTKRTQASVPAAVLSMAECMVFMALSFTEHLKSVGPPLLLDGYLVVSILFDVVRTRTLWLSGARPPIAVIFTLTVGMKLSILVLEESGKRRWTIAGREPWSNEVTGGVFSRTLFTWLDRMMWHGYSNALSVPSLPAIDSSLLSDYIWAHIGPEIEKQSISSHHSLMWTVFWKFKGFLLAPVLPYLVIVASQLAQPFLINTVLAYVQSPYDGSQEQKNIGYGLIAAYGLVYVCIAVATAWGQHLSYRFVVLLRGVLVTSIYRKTMSTSVTVAADASAVTLMSTDVERIALGMAKIHDAWSTLIQVGCAMYILYGQVGVVFVAPIVISIVSCIAAVGLSSFAGAFQASWMESLEKRIATTSALIGSVKGVKMLGWTGKASEIIQKLRLAEIASARKFRLMLLAVVTVSFIPVALAPVATFGIFSAKSAGDIGEQLGSNRIFTTLSLLALITQPLDLLFAYIPEILAAVACFSRIEKYLRQESPAKIKNCGKSVELNNSSIETLANNSPSDTGSRDIDEKQSPNGIAIELQEATFGWNSEEEPVLSKINLTIPTRKLTLIIGPIASGKSTLLKGILGETPVCDGVLHISSPHLSFCDQTPWMANESIRNNITGSAHFDAMWYSKVIRACALEDDLRRFTEGDKMIIGSNGLSLSGGQKQRVAIARAVYAKRDLCLFDDVFSGLDLETQARIMRDVFGPQGLLKSHRATAVLVTHASHLLVHAEYVVLLTSGGQIAEQGPPEKFRNKQHIFEEPYRLSVISKPEAENDQDAGKSLLFKPETAGLTPAEMSVDTETQRLGDGAVYKYYFETFGWKKTAVFFGLQVSLVFCIKFPEIILSWWGEANDKDPGHYNGTYFGIFTVLEVASLVLLGLICAHVLLNLAVVSGIKLHHKLLRSTLRAPLSFFTITDVGSITNRFSQDINLVDMELPFSFINFVCNGLTCVAQALMIIPASPWLLIGYPLLFGGLWLLQRVYLRTSRQLRFLDLDAKSPIYGQFLETLNGLATIRAFSWEKDLIAKADERLDYSQKPFYLLYSIQRWLNLVLDLVVACLAVVVIAVAVALRSSTSVGFAGVALFNIMTLSAALKSAITSWTLLETSIGAVARVKMYEQSTPDENLGDEKQQPPPAWPTSGTIAFNNVTAAYKDDGDKPAIIGMSLHIDAGEKVGICGRSGSGKSSTILALFRLINCQKGTITIDGVDISLIPRESLRERLTAVPQDPVFLAGSVRLNCDPSGTSSDESIIETLRIVKLWEIIEARGGLDTELASDMFSKGQQQIFSLARALVHHSRIVVMDEASSSLDADSENLMMSLLEQKFKDTTVISIAHRLDTILDFDKVVLLDEGAISEVGNPRELLSRASAFRSLYESSTTD
ncbi:hypothetical protein JX266_012761 [Neoarthrinium moseri]|nr:hypothetical protein JX266_012761 [Neoarthrinium moseri]